jgi:spermidine synthase
MFTANYKKMGAYMDFLAHQNPSLKLLEIGAGTGSSTEQILPFLCHDAGNGQIVFR